MPDAPRRYTSKVKNAQEAHEAIRPTDLARLPADVIRFLDCDQARLYELIWKRTIASQMASAELERTTIEIDAVAPSGKAGLRATGTVIRFDGFLTLYQEGRDDEDDEEGGRLPADVRRRAACAREKIDATQHFTEPPPRYTEASLIKKMEELGIGRPSTYARRWRRCRKREYVRLDRKRLVPEDKGRIVTAFLEDFFKRYVEFDFTADLEEKLDRISAGELSWKDVLRDFWRDFAVNIAQASEISRSEVIEALNELLADHLFPARADGGDPRECPACKAGKLSLKLGKFGAFIGCSNYPECRYTRQLGANGEDAAAVAAFAGRNGARRRSGDGPAGDAAQRPLRPLFPARPGPEKGGEKPKRASHPERLGGRPDRP